MGKSALLDEFAVGKRHVVYQAVEGTVADQLRDMTEAILACQDDPVLRVAPLPNWDAAFAYLARMAAEGPLLVIFDEYQYVAEADPTLASRSNAGGRARPFSYRSSSSSAAATYGSS